MNQLELDPALLNTLRTLESHELEFVLIGEFARAIYDDGGFVAGIEIVPGAYSRNVERLDAALQALGARLASTGSLSPAAVDYRNVDLRELAPCTFATAEADIDLNFEPDGTSGYRDLFADAARIELAPGVSPLVASLEDLERIDRGDVPEPPPAPPPRALPPEPDLLWPTGQEPEMVWPGDHGPEMICPTDEEPEMWPADEIHATRRLRVHHDG